MHKIGLTFCLAVLVASGIVQSVSILGPKLLRPYGNYKISIAGGSRAHNLYVAIEGKRSTGEPFSQGRVVQVPAAASRLVDLEIGDPGPGQYKLVARSTSGPLFASSAPLIYQPRSFCVFVQTDKRVYQPRDTVNFRVIALDKYLLPLSGTVDISILDTGGSPVRQWASVPLDRGLFAEELLLADEPALGQWTIQVEARGQKYSRQIMVADYVLPKFQMDIQMPKEILFSDGRFSINVTARHFNGLPVKGELTISAYAVFFSGLLQPVFSTPSRKVVDFNGQANVVYDLKTDLDLAEDAARPLVVEAVLEEKNTLIKQNISSRILLLRTPYRLKVTAPDRFKPTLPYNVQIELVNSTGHTINTTGDITVARQWDDGAPVNTTTVKLNKGFAKYMYTPDVAHTNSTLNLVVKYKEISERVVNVQKSIEKGGQYLIVEMLTRDTRVGDEMRAQISATEPMDLVHYVIIGRGDILAAKTLELSPARRSVDVSVPVTADMAPGCILLAWYPRLAGDNVLSAAVYAPQREMLQHKISVTSASSGSLLRPNGLVEFRVSGEAGSQAALLGGDDNAILTGLTRENGLGSGLDMYTIEREVESFTGLKHSLFKNEDHLPSLGLDLGGRNSSDVFSNAGMVLLTDGLVIASNKLEASEPETGTRAPQAGPYAFSRVPSPPSPRYYLTRTLSPHVTWMFTNFTIGNDGVGTRERWSPVTPGEWTVGAFAVHPTLGLGIAEPRKVATALPISLTAELPDTLQKGETLAVIVTLKSTLTVDTSIEVTFHNSEQFYEFEPLENSIDSAKKIELFRRLRVIVPARSSKSTAFLVTSVRSGEAPIIIEANGNGVSASLFRTIDVKNGYEEKIWSWALLDGRRGVARTNVTLTPAAGTKIGAVSLEATGDLLANALRAIKSPSTVAADAYYALRPLARACILLDYLQATDQDDEVTIVKDARLQASTGYQRLMAFRRPDGSFAAETGDDAESDVWMTSIAARWLSRSSRYVEVSPEATMAAARWLINSQKSDGSWQTPSSMQKNDPRAQTVVPLTAYALLALQETKSNEFNIDNDNALIIQTQLVRNALNASAVTEGRGVAMVGLAAKGSTNVTAAWPRYTLDPRVDQVSTRERLQLSICIGFVPIANETESGLTLLTVQLPSGYLADLNTITELTSIFDTKNTKAGSQIQLVTTNLTSRTYAVPSCPRSMQLGPNIDKSENI
ncbi:jg9350 [Pararge aegeria aegeria]|uniref:TEP1-F n=1 Tax=Pararge aegeria aegeria TaxID=348720 RepID=A0A8S4S6L4_9NEOP|nr:jg9350 [Pararge aegeria aegeria]